MGEGQGTLTPTGSNNALFLSSHIQLTRAFVSAFKMALKFIPLLYTA